MKKEKYMLLNKALNDDYCIFSLIGSHAGETKDAILERKSRDILTTGNTFWVAKFGKDKIEQYRQIKGLKKGYLIMLEPTKSGGAKDTKKSDPATLFSKDKIEWTNLDSRLSPITGNLGNGTSAFNISKIEIVQDVEINLGDYQQSEKGEDVKFNQFCGTILAKKRENSLVENKRKVAAIMQLEYPYCVWVK